MNNITESRLISGYIDISQSGDFISRIPETGNYLIYWHYSGQETPCRRSEANHIVWMTEWSRDPDSTGTCDLDCRRKRITYKMEHDIELWNAGLIY